jgi:hypothetical protein
MAVNRLKDIIDNAYLQGKNITSYIRKVSAIATAAGFWVDLSMTTGNPTPNYYVGAEKEVTIPTTWYKKGIWTGGAVSPDKKFLHKIMLLGTAAAIAPAQFILCDYLMYYPLIDMDTTDEQLLKNYGPTITPTTDPSLPTLPRYTDGKGVMAFLVATNPYIGGAQFYITYTNSDGVTERQSRIATTNTSTYIGTLVNSNNAGIVGNYQAFIPLKEGDVGIKSIQSITFISPNGGLACLVLVKPVATMVTREATAWCEIDFIIDKPSLPRIYDGAYLSFLCNTSATIAAVPLIGEITFIWSS